MHELQHILNDSYLAFTTRKWIDSSVNCRQARFPNFSNMHTYQTAHVYFPYGVSS